MMVSHHVMCPLSRTTPPVEKEPEKVEDPAFRVKSSILSATLDKASEAEDVILLTEVRMEDTREDMELAMELTVLETEDIAPDAAERMPDQIPEREPCIVRNADVTCDLIEFAALGMELFSPFHTPVASFLILDQCVFASPASSFRLEPAALLISPAFLDSTVLIPDHVLEASVFRPSHFLTAFALMVSHVPERVVEIPFHAVAAFSFIRLHASFTEICKASKACEKNAVISPHVPSNPFRNPNAEFSPIP